MTVSRGYATYGTYVVREELSVKAVDSKIEEAVNSIDKLTLNVKSRLKYTSIACLSREKTIVRLREFPINAIRRDLILPTELPMSAQDPNSGFSYAYYKEMSKSIKLISNAIKDNKAYLNKVALAFGLYNEKFFNLVAYDRVFKRYLYYFFLSASELPSSFNNVYCLAPKLDPSMRVKNALFYLNRIVVCTHRYDVVAELKREERFKDMDVLMFTGLEGKKLSGVWENIQNPHGLDKIDDVLMLPGGQVRLVDEKYDPETSTTISVLGPGDEKWNWNPSLNN